jgi:predicted ferric reductase
MAENDKTVHPLAPETRRRLGWILALAAAALFLFMVFIPTTIIPNPVKPGDTPGFSATLALMCAAGAAFGVLFQFILSAKLKILDRVFAAHRLLALHRWTGLTTAVLATAHPVFLFILGPADWPPWKLRFWPLYLGPLLLAMLWAGALAGFFRQRIGLPYQFWYRMHQTAMFLAAAIAVAHPSLIGRDFSRPWALYILLGLASVYVLAFAWKKVVLPSLVRIKPYTVSDVQKAGAGTWDVEVTPPGEIFGYAPGQFALVSFSSEELPGQRHPWTIASAPTRPGRLVFTIKESGDFTNHIGRLRPGDKAAVDGPYGLFTPLAHPNVQGPLILAAGGIGITPMLSMLRYLADTDSERRIILVWSNRDQDHVVHSRDLEELAERLPRLEVVHVMTRQPDFHGLTGRLDADKLSSILEGVAPDALAMVCGPPGFMDSVSGALQELGFSQANIKTERFTF